MELATVKVKHPDGDGYMIINQAEYDANPDAYELYEPKGKPSEKKTIEEGTQGNGPGKVGGAGSQGSGSDAPKTDGAKSGKGEAAKAGKAKAAAKKKGGE